MAITDPASRTATLPLGILLVSHLGESSSHLGVTMKSRELLEPALVFPRFADASQ